MNIVTWIINKLAKPLLPILNQSHKVLSIIISTLQDVLISGISINSPTYEKIKSVIDAINIIQAVISKIIVFLGETVPVEAQANANLKDEIEKLKILI